MTQVEFARKMYENYSKGRGIKQTMKYWDDLWEDDEKSTVYSNIWNNIGTTYFGTLNNNLNKTANDVIKEVKTNKINKYKNDNNKKENDTMSTNNLSKNVTNSLSSLFHKLAPGQCRLTMNGIGVKTSNGYKTFDPITQTLVNCGDFVLDIGDDMFFCIPTNNVQQGDIIIASGSPVCVISMSGNRIEALRYEDSTVQTIIPENIMFMGGTYFYSKVFSPFSGMINGNDPSQLMSLMMMSQMMSGDNNGSGMGNLMVMGMMLNGGFNFGNIFNGMFGGLSNAGASPANSNNATVFTPPSNNTTDATSNG